MFIKTTVFKKLIKQAYETGSLLVAGTENEYIISGNWWIIRVKKDVFSKKNKAAIIELTGEFPEEGEAFRPTKNAGNQYEIAENPAWDITKAFYDAKEGFIITKATYELNRNRIRILQNKSTNECVPINQIMIDLIDTEALEEGEGYPVGPNAPNKQGEIMYWHNNTMTLAACTIATNCNEGEQSELSKYLQLLENIELKGS